MLRPDWFRSSLVLPILLAAIGLTLPVRSASISPKATLQLFNGRDLSGFTTWLQDARKDDPRRVFSVVNGMLRLSGDGLGYLATIQEYQDYHLIAEFRWGTQNTHWGDRDGKARDAGLFVHAFGPDGNSVDGKGAFMAGIECNIFQGATGDLLLIRGRLPNGYALTPRLTALVGPTLDSESWPFWQPDGSPKKLQSWGRVNWRDKSPQWSDVLDFRGPKDVEKAYGEWNRLECLCQGDRVTIKLNGQVVNEAFDIYPAQGKILLQCEGSEIFFRKLELRPLP